MVERKLDEEAKEAEKLFRLRKRSRGMQTLSYALHEEGDGGQCFARGHGRIQRCGCLKVESSVPRGLAIS